MADGTIDSPKLIKKKLPNTLNSRCSKCGVLHPVGDVISFLCNVCRQLNITKNKCQPALNGRRCDTHNNLPLYPNGKCIEGR